MKFLLATLMLSVFTTSVFSAEIKRATLDASRKYIVLTVVHGGGCGTHDFSLEMNECLESSPVQCTAKLVHRTNDFCEAIKTSTVVLPLTDYNLNSDYYSQGSLTITGSNDTNAVVYLP